MSSDQYPYQTWQDVIKLITQLTTKIQEQNKGKKDYHRKHAMSE